MGGLHQDTPPGALTPGPSSGQIVRFVMRVPLTFKALAIALRGDGLADVDRLAEVRGAPAVDEAPVLTLHEVVVSEGGGSPQPDLLPPHTGGQAGGGRQVRQEGGGGLQPGGVGRVSLVTAGHYRVGKIPTFCESLRKLKISKSRSEYPCPDSRG